MNSDKYIYFLCLESEILYAIVFGSREKIAQ